MRTLPPAVSGAWPLAGHTLEFIRHSETAVTRGLREHGPVFSLRLAGRTSVVLVGAEHARFFFSETDKRLSLRSAYPFFVRMFDSGFYLFAEFDEYQRQRGIVMRRFQARQVGAYIELMERQAVDLIDGLGAGGEFDLTPVFGPLVMRIAAQCFLGDEFAARLGDDWFTEFRRFSAGMDPVTPPWLPMPHLIRSRRARDRLRSVLRGFLQERREHPVDPSDFFQTLAEARFADGAAVPDLVLVNLILLLTWAGHETTTGHLAWALVDLLQHPADLEAVLAEQRRVLDPGQPLSAAVIHQLSHLDAALHESERLHPVANLLARGAAEDFEYAGYRIARHDADPVDGADPPQPGRVRRSRLLPPGQVPRGPEGALAARGLRRRGAPLSRHAFRVSRDGGRRHDAAAAL